MTFGRRTLIAATLGAPCVAQAQPKARVIVVGGGFGGATAARTLKRVAPDIDVVLIEPNPVFTACPASNAVIAGLRDHETLRFTYKTLEAEGIRLIHQRVIAIDAAHSSLTLADNTRLDFTRAILAPGIAIRWNALPGYTEAAAAVMPHAWRGGAQIMLLRERLAAVPDGGLVVISVPATPYRCPSAPYERASLVAHHLKLRKPRAKLIVLDSNDSFSMQRLFLAAWKSLYPNLEHLALSASGKVTEVNAGTGEIRTDFETYTPDLANIIPPQRAADIAVQSGVADRTGWCPITPVTFESLLCPGIHVIGDATLLGAMPKSAFAAAAQAKACAHAVALILNGQTPEPPHLLNTCYALIAPHLAISSAGVYRHHGTILVDTEGAGGNSALDAPRSTREAEARHAEAWFHAVTTEAFG